jgi:hypothetical protein
MNLVDLRARARDESGIAASSIVSDATLNAYINESYLELARMRPWPWARQSVLIETEAGIASYALPAGLQHVEVVTARTGDRPRTLDQRTAFDIDAIVRPAAFVQGEGLPLEYGVNDARSEITLFPTPSAGESLVVLYQATPEVMAGTASPSFDAQFHHMLALMAAVKALISRGDESKRVEGFVAQIRQLIVEMERWYLTNPDPSWSVAAGSNRRAWNGRRNGAAGWSR